MEAAVRPGCTATWSGKMKRLAILLMLPLPTFAQTTLLFEDDFEIQDASEWQVTQTNGTVDVLKTLPHSGSWSVRHTLNSGTVNTLMRRDFAPSAVAYGRA